MDEGRAQEVSPESFLIEQIIAYCCIVALMLLAVVVWYYVHKHS